MLPLICGTRNPSAGAGGGEGLEQSITIANTTGSQAADVPVSFGIVAPDATYAAGQIPQLLKGGSAVAYQQVDNEEYWASGALKRCTLHAILASHEIADANNAFEVHKKNLTQSHTAGVSWADVLAYDGSAFNWTWSLDLDDGATWEADIRTAGNGGTVNGYSAAGPSNFGLWNKGPVCCEWRVEMPLRRTGDSANHAVLRAEFHVRVYKDTGLRDIRVDAFVNNGRAASDNGNYPVRNAYLFKNGQSRATAAWKREAVAPATTLTVTGGSLTDGDAAWTATAGSSVFNTAHRGRPIVVNGKGVLYPITFSSGTALGCMALFTRVSICKTQNGAAGSLSFDGSLASGGTVKMQGVGGRRQRVLFYSASDNSGATFTVNGTTAAGADSEAVTGPTAGNAVYTTKDFITVTSITYTGTPNQIQVGTGGYDKTAAASSGAWEIWAFALWDGARLRRTVMHATGRPQRFVPKYDKAKINLSRTFPKYNLTRIGSQAGGVAGKVAQHNGWPNAGAWGDTLDFNPFFFNGWSGGDTNGVHEYVGHRLREPDSGERDEIGILSQWSLNWIEQQTNNAWRTLLEHEDGIFGYPVHFIDDSTGHPVEPLNRPGYQRSNIPQRRTMPDAGDVGYFEGSFSNVAGFNPWNMDVAHRGEWGFTGYMMTGDLCYLQALQAMAVFEWLSAPSSFGTGYNRDLIEAGIQTRSMAWALRGLAYAATATPATLYDGVCLARGVPQGILNGVMDIAEGQWVSPGPDPDGFYSDAVANTPTKGDWHTVNAGDDGNKYAHWQHHFAITGLGAAVRNQVLNANGVAFAKWMGQLSIDLVTKTSAVNPRYVAMQYWIRSKFSGQPKTLADMYAWARDPANRPTAVVVEGAFHSVFLGDTFTISGDATGIGNAITLTGSAARFFPDHVGAFVLKMSGSGDGAAVLGRATINSVTNDTTIVCTVNQAFDSNAAFASTRLGLPNAGANLAGVIQAVKGRQDYDTNYMTYWATGLAVISAFPDIGPSAASAYDTLEGWLDATVTAGFFDWSTYPRALLEPY